MNTRSSKPAMNRKTRQTLAALGACWVAFAVSSSTYGSAPEGPPAAPADAAPALTEMQAANPLIVRGRYLVEQVGLCADCHSPRTPTGHFIREQWMLGAALPFQPMVPMPWAPAAPPLAGLPAMNDQQAIEFLRTGKRPDGSMSRPPMPPFRFDTEDASAVVAYLRSLGK
jgi:mono/diheme cytochrome c family protein